MVRLYVIGTLIVTLGATGLFFGLSAAAPTSPKDATGRIIEVAENGGPKQKCKILKEWVEPDGARAFQVEAIDTGEIMTMVTSGPVTTDLSSGNKVKTITTRIYHWGRDKTPPPNAPVPPAAAIVRDVPKALPDAVVHDKPKTSPATLVHEQPKSANTDHPSIIQTQAATPATPSPANGGRVWPPAFGNGPGAQSSQTSGPMLPGSTIIQTAIPTRTPTPGSGGTQLAGCSSPYQVSGCPSGKCVAGSCGTSSSQVITCAASGSPYQASGCVCSGGSCQPCVVECPQHGACLPTVVECPTQCASQPCVIECPHNGSCQPCVIECPHGGSCQQCVIENGRQVPVCCSPYQGSECPCECGDAKPQRRTLLDRLRGTGKTSCDCSKTCQPVCTDVGQGDGSIIAPGKLPDSIPTKPDNTAALNAIMTDNKSLGAPATPTPDDKSVAKTTTTPQPKNWRDSWHLFHRNKPDDKADVAKLDSAKKDTASKSDLPQADVKRADPLTSPEAYTSKLPAEYDTKPKSLPAPVEPPVKTVSAPAPAKDVPSAVLPAYTKNDPPAAAPTAPAASAPSNNGVPLGAVSVAQSGNPPYLPVSVVTLPPVQRMPAPPPPRVPQAPQPNQALLVNAFSAPASTAPAATTSDLSGNAFSPPAAPASETGAGAFTDGYANVANRSGQAGYPQGYVRMAYGASPQGYPMGQQVYGPGYGPGGYPPVPFNGAAQPGQYAQAQAMQYGQMQQAGYYGPMGQGVMPAGYHPAGLPYQPAPPYQQLAMASVAAASAPQQPASNAGADPAHLLAMLRESLYPSEREWAADKLAVVDWRTNGQVVDALVMGAKEDPAPAVRAGCVRTLGRMNANTMPVVTAVNGLKSDTDPRVQREVEQALARLAPGQQSHADSAVQPASAVVPAKSN
jgi:hypothetical protein